MQSFQCPPSTGWPTWPPRTTSWRGRRLFSIQIISDLRERTYCSTSTMSTHITHEFNQLEHSISMDLDQWELWEVAGCKSVWENHSQFPRNVLGCDCWPPLEALTLSHFPLKPVETGKRWDGQLYFFHHKTLDEGLHHGSEAEHSVPNLLRAGLVNVNICCHLQTNIAISFLFLFFKMKSLTRRRPGGLDLIKLFRISNSRMRNEPNKNDGTNRKTFFQPYSDSISFYQMFIVTQTMKQWITLSIFKFTSHMGKF